MKLIQDIYAEDITDWRNNQFYVNCETGQYKIGWDLHLPNGQRVYILEMTLETIFVWRNAIIIGINHVEGLE